MLIRAATEADLQALIVLNADVQRWHADTYPYRFKPNPDPKAIQKLFSDKLVAPDARLLLAIKNTTSVGYLFLSIVDVSESAISYAMRRVHVEHVVVDPAHRREGIGSALLSHAETIAREVEADEMTLDSWAANTAAHAAFTSSGLERTRLWFAKRL